jgi:hypothetical protein
MSDTPKAIATLVLFGFDLYIYPYVDGHCTLRIKRNVYKGEAMLVFQPNIECWTNSRSSKSPDAYKRVAWEDYMKELGRLTPAAVKWLVNAAQNGLEE